jgi:hypothetical protein
MWLTNVHVTIERCSDGLVRCCVARVGASGAAAAVTHTPAAAAAFCTSYIGRQCSPRSFATETAADKFELFSPEAGLTHIEGCVTRNPSGLIRTSLRYATQTAQAAAATPQDDELRAFVLQVH